MTMLAIVQMKLSDDRDQNVTDALSKVKEAAAAGARIILLPELFEGHYFPQVARERFSAGRTRWRGIRSSRLPGAGAGAGMRAPGQFL